MRQALASEHMGKVVYAYRTHPYHLRPFTQDAVAAWAEMTQAQISRIETRASIVNLDRLGWWARLLEIPPHLLWFGFPARSGANRDGLLGGGPEGQFDLSPGDSQVAGDWFDDLSVIGERRQRAGASNVDEAILTYLKAAVHEAIGENERRPPAELAPRVLGLRMRVEQLLHSHQPPPQRARLYEVAAHLSGILGVLALDLGLFDHAVAYGGEAFDLAAAVNEPNLLAWTRAGQSLIAYYAGDYHSALAYARDGLRRAPHGPHSIRLTLNGEARALARLGDRYGVDAAVDRGFALLDRLEPAPTVSASLTVEPYCAARAAANAATSYLALGAADRVAVHAGQALRAFDRAELRGPQALSRLDIATAAIQQSTPDVEYACELTVEALAITADQRFESVNQRAREFLHSARPWARLPRVREVSAIVAQRGRPTLPTRSALPSDA